jgi:predicted RNA-binding Zn ribbon-like protein
MRTDMTTDAPAPGPADVPPLHGEPLPLEFANTVYPVRGVLRDGLGSPERLARWLEACCDRLATPLPAGALEAVTAEDVLSFVMLRDVTRRLTEAHVRRLSPDSWDVAQLNRASSMDRPWPSLRWIEGGRPTLVQMCPAPPLVAVQSEIAHSLIGMLTGTSGVQPRACQAPGCVLFFDRARSRREWCSTGCGNRARVARHYARRNQAQ